MTLTERKKRWRDVIEKSRATRKALMAAIADESGHKPIDDYRQYAEQLHRILVVAEEIKIATAISLIDREIRFEDTEGDAE